MSDLENLRDEILKIDQNIISSIAKRNSISKKIGEIKILNKLPIHDPKREEYLQNFYKHLSKKYDLSFILIEQIFALIIEYSKRTQNNE